MARADVQQILSSFVPSDASEGDVLDDIRARATAAQFDRRDAARSAISAGYRLDVWATQEGYENPFEQTVIDRFVDEALAGVATGTQNSTRSLLNALAKGAERPRRRMPRPVVPITVAGMPESARNEPLPRQADVSVSENVAATIESWVPNEVSETRWNPIAEEVRRRVVASAPGTTKTAKLRLRLGSLFMAWLADTGRHVDDATFKSALAEEFVDLYGTPEASYATYLSALRSLARPKANASTQTSSDERIEAPYARHDIAAMLNATRSLNQWRSRTTTRALLLLGAGAGVVGGHEAGQVRTTDIITSGTTTEVDVRGGDGTVRRRVPVLNRWAPSLVTVTEEMTERGVTHLLGGDVTTDRQKRPGELYERLRKVGVDLDPRRLRRYWLVEAFSGSVPLLDALRAAGLTSAEPLDEILQWVVAPRPDKAARLIASGAAL